MIKLHDKFFKPYISKDEISAAIEQLAEQISQDFEGQCPLLISVLNGSFIFAADLVRAMSIDCEITFVKLKSYSGTSSSGNAHTLLGLEHEIADRPVIIIEDIVDTGHTISHLLAILAEYNPSDVRIACLLHKPEALVTPLIIDYIGFQIPNKFVVGYGLDYDGLGRNYVDIYQLSD